LVSDDLLIDLLASKSYYPKEKVLLILAYCDGDPVSIAAIQVIAINHGGTDIAKRNVRQILSRDLKGHVTELPDGWILTPSGRKYVQHDVLPQDPASTREAALHLRSYLNKIANPDTRDFVEEAVECLEASLLRSAVIMSWVGAVSVLYDHVVTCRLEDFNARADKTRPRGWNKPAVTREDLATIGESDFLDIIANLSIITDNVKKELKSRLTLRNSCGHPNDFPIEKYQVEAHIASLISHVYSKF
jgi:hypothetical protein